jgi:hypothetical protein
MEVLEWFEYLKGQAGGNMNFISDVLDIITKMLSPVPEDRPEAKDVLSKFKDVLSHKQNRMQLEYREDDSEDDTISTPRTPPADPHCSSPEIVGSPLSDLGPGSHSAPNLHPARRASIASHISFRSAKPTAPLMEKSKTEHIPRQPEQSQSSLQGVPMSRHASNDPQLELPKPPRLRYKVPYYLEKHKGRGGRRNSGHSPFEYLRQFDTVFLIDDSETMIPVWNAVAVALWRFLDLAMDYDPDGVDLYFMNSDNFVRDATSMAEVFGAFQTVQPSGTSFINLKLDKLLTNYIQRFRHDRERTKRLNLIVLTDGEYSTWYSPDDALTTCAKALDKLGAPSCQVGVQFVLIGSGEEAQTKFKVLDDELYKRNGVR